MSAKDRFAKPLFPGARTGYRSPSPGVPVIGTTHTSGKRWSRVISGSLTMMQGLTPRCSCPTVGLSSTTTTVPRSSLTSVPRPILHRAPTEPLFRLYCRGALRHPHLAVRESIPQYPVRRDQRFLSVDSARIGEFDTPAAIELPANGLGDELAAVLFHAGRYP